jgi:hypothetical protein
VVRRNSTQRYCCLCMQFLKRKVSHKCKDVAPFVKSWEPSDPTSGKVKLLQSEVITVHQHNLQQTFTI